MKSKLAIASFILGLIPLTALLITILLINRILSLDLSILLIMIFLTICSSIAGLILGIISIFVIKMNKLEGIWLSILGIIFSLSGVIVLGLFIGALSQGSLFPFL